MNPKLTHHYHPKSTVYMRIHSGCCIHSVGLDKCIMTCIHHYDTTQNIFTAPKILCALPICPSLPSPPFHSVPRYLSRLRLNLSCVILMEAFAPKRCHLGSSCCTQVDFTASNSLGFPGLCFITWVHVSVCFSFLSFFCWFFGCSITNCSIF